MLKNKYHYKKYGLSFDIFTSDSDYFDSVVLNILQIGENANILSKDFKEKTKNTMPWGGIIRTRNIIAHGYMILDNERLWDIVINDIPVLKAFCESQFANIDLEELD